MPTDQNSYLILVATIACLGAAVSTLEWLSNRRQLMDDGLFSWEVIGSRPLTVEPGALGRCMNLLLPFRPFLCILVARLIALLLLPVTLYLGRGHLLALAVIVATSLLLNFRSPYGMDGSDQMSTQIFGALFLGYLAGSPLALAACLWFIAGQSCLSYLTSGLAKALSPHWRAGGAIFAIFNTRTYGYEPVARVLHYRQGLTRALTWGAVIMECAFPLALLVGYPGCLIFLAWGVAFHVTNAFVMGLNSFFWAFIATYPAIIYCAIELGRYL